MTSNIFSSLYLGLNSFFANKVAMDIVGHNIANVNTPGYSRQRAVMTPVTPMRTAIGLLGRGVEVNTVTQIRNEFYEKDIQEQLKKYGFYSAEKSSFEQIETIISNDNDSGLSASITNMFNFFEDLSTNPEDYPTRQSVYYAALDLTNTIKEMRGNLDRQRTNMDLAVKDSIEDINLKLDQIASLNEDIIREKPNGNTNDFVDQRTNLLQELSQKIDVNYFLEENGSMTVMKGGITLVSRNHFNSIEGKVETSNNGYVDVYVNLSGKQENITDNIKYGELGAYIDVRDNKIVNYIDEIDELTKSIITEVNKVHSSGIGLTNFTIMTGTYSVYDPDIALDDAQNVVEGHLMFAPQNGSFKLTVTDLNGNKVISEIDVNPSESLNQLAAKIDAVDNISASIDANNHLVITSDAGYEFNLSDDSSYALAALGLNTFFDGYTGKDVSVNDVIANDPSKIAASITGVAGDGDNAIALAGLRDEKLLAGDTTFTEYYSLIVSKVGSHSRSMITSLSASETSLTATQNLRDSISGVTIDEELANMMKFQRTYEASARFISTIDNMINTLINELYAG